MHFHDGPYLRQDNELGRGHRLTGSVYTLHLTVRVRGKDDPGSRGLADGTTPGGCHGTVCDGSEDFCPSVAPRRGVGVSRLFLFHPVPGPVRWELELEWADVGLLHSLPLGRRERNKEGRESCGGVCGAEKLRYGTSTSTRTRLRCARESESVRSSLWSHVSAAVAFLHCDFPAFRVPGSRRANIIAASSHCPRH